MDGVLDMPDTLAEGSLATAGETDKCVRESVRSRYLISLDDFLAQDRNLTGVDPKCKVPLLRCS